MTIMNNCSVVIRGSDNLAKATAAILALNIPYVRPMTSGYYDSNAEFLADVFNDFGFDCYVSDDEFGVCELSNDRMDKYFEPVLKAISRYVEPGSFFEFDEYGDLYRYVFLFDTVEKWTVPHITYAKKEAI